MTNPVQLSKKELNKVFWRSYQALGCYTYDKQQGISYMRALLPALQKLYPDPEDLKEALIRHNVMFNTTCAFVPFCLGITCAMEEEYANAPEGTFDPQSISSVKIALMGRQLLLGNVPGNRLRDRRSAGCGRQSARGRAVSVVKFTAVNLDPCLWL